MHETYKKLSTTSSTVNIRQILTLLSIKPRNHSMFFVFSPERTIKLCDFIVPKSFPTFSDSFRKLRFFALLSFKLIGNPSPRCNRHSKSQTFAPLSIEALSFFLTITRMSCFEIRALFNVNILLVLQCRKSRHRNYNVNVTQRL